MQTHTIRNKRSNTPIVTLSKPFFELLKQKRKFTICTFVSKFLDSLYQLTRKKHQLDYQQNLELSDIVVGEIPQDGEESYHCRMWFTDGIRVLDVNLITLVNILEYFAEKMELE